MYFFGWGSRFNWVFFGTGCLFWELVGGRDELFSFLKFLLFLNFNNLLLMTFGNGGILFKMGRFGDLTPF